MIKIALIIIAGVLTIVGLFASEGILQSSAQYLFDRPAVLSLIVLAIGIQLVGHWFRALRTKLVLDQAASSSKQFQFGALSIGYLFNALLPFRLGELIRALLVAKRLQISFLYTLVAIIIERATDVIFLATLIVLGALFVHGAGSVEVLFVALVGMLVSVVLLYSLLLLRSENKYLLGFVSWFTQLFNVRISNTLRFKIWSLIFGLQNFFSNPAYVRKYLVYAMVSWVCYFVSAAIIVIALLQPSDLLETIVTSVSPYIVSFSPVDAASYQQLATFLSTQFAKESLEIYAKVLWIVLTIPMAIIGFAALASFKTGAKSAAKRPDVNIYTNKLMRHQDISQDFPAFLDSYFKGNDLAKVLHKIEVTGELSLVRYFKGGSDAITVLVLAGDQLFVKKIIPIEYRDRLKAQYDWLVAHKKMKYLVDVIGEQSADDYYAIDLAYNPKNIPYFEYAHHSSLTESKHVLENVWKALYGHLHDNKIEPEYDPKARNAYVTKHIDGCVEKAAAIHSELRTLLERPTIVINGKEYDNLRQIMQKIKKNKQAWRDIATYTHSSAVHGDPSIDNILVNPNNDRPLIIDPAPDGNIIEGPVFDLGKFSQSFYCGYEFSFRDEDEVRLEGRNSVRYREHVSARYSQLWRFVSKELAPQYVSEAEQRAMIFHAGALHIRRLKHQAVSNPENTLKFYAVGVKTLNEFLDQYK